VTSQIDLFFRDNIRALKLWHVWAYLAWQDVISKYRRSILGPLWIAGGMVSTSLAISISLGAMSGQPLREFLPFAMAGILVWTHFIGILISEAPELFVGAQGSIKNNAFPFMFYVFRFAARSLIIFLHNIVVLFLVMLSVSTKTYMVMNMNILLFLLLALLSLLLLLVVVVVMIVDGTGTGIVVVDTVAVAVVVVVVVVAGTGTVVVVAGTGIVVAGSGFVVAGGVVEYRYSFDIPVAG